MSRDPIQRTRATHRNQFNDSVVWDGLKPTSILVPVNTSVAIFQARASKSVHKKHKDDTQKQQASKKRRTALRQVPRILRKKRTAKHDRFRAAYCFLETLEDVLEHEEKYLRLLTRIPVFKRTVSLLKQRPVTEARPSRRSNTI